MAGINLNIFNKHCDRVKMANIAQLVNVLQAVILTEGDKMIKTPTYHVFDMYKHHQEAELVRSFVENEEIGIEDEFKTPALQESVSLGKDGKLHITLNNLSVDKDYEIETLIADKEAGAVSGEIVGGEYHEHNTFDDPERVTKKSFNDFKVSGDRICFTIPRSSVLHLAVEI